MAGKMPPPSRPVQHPPGRPSQPPRTGGGVPPLDAFDNVPKRTPPNLPGRDLPESQPARPQPKEMPQQIAPKAKKERRRHRRPVNPAKRRRNRRIAAVVFLLVLIGAGIWYSVDILFKIENFVVMGEKEAPLPYTEEEILANFPKQVGDNMFEFDAGELAKEMQQRLPYAETVAIRRRLPNTLVFTVTPATETYCMVWGSGYAVLSAQLKTLRIAEEYPAGLVEIKGLIGVEPQPGFALSVSDKVLARQAEEYAAALAAQPAAESPAPEPPAESAADSLVESTPEQQTTPEPEQTEEALPEQQGEAEQAEAPPEENLPVEPVALGAGVPVIPAMEPEELLEEANLRYLGVLALLEQLAGAGFENVNWVNAQSSLELSFRWEDRITVLLGPKGELDKKVHAAYVMLTDVEQSGITQADRGTLDLRLYLTTKEIRFRME